MITLESRLLKAFRDEVYRHTGVHLTDSKDDLLAGRLRRRMRACDLEDPQDYLKLIKRGDRKELPFFIDAVTTHKTSLFRTREIWRYLWEEDLPKRLEASSKIRAWSAACSTGQEAASLTVLLAEAAKAHRPGLRFDVEASDVSAPVVDTARKMRFEARDVIRAEKLCPEFDLGAHFKTVDGQMELSAALRARQTFSVHNLFQPAGARRVDLLFVRNVLIYFTPPDKAKVVRLLLDALAPGGLLVIGESESLFEMDVGLERVTHCVFKRSGS